MKTYRFTKLFLYCSGGEHSVMCVRPSFQMEISKEEQRGVVRFLLAEGVGMLLDRIILLPDNAHPVLPVW